MEYRLYTGAAKANDKCAWGFVIVNQVDFVVYHRGGVFEKSEMSDRQIHLETAVRALSYFSNFMRRRYYDEHFATILDEDGITLFSPVTEIAECKKNQAWKDGFSGDDKEIWTSLIQFFERPSIKFETLSENKYLSLAHDCAADALKK